MKWLYIYTYIYIDIPGDQKAARKIWILKYLTNKNMNKHTLGQVTTWAREAKVF